MRTPLRRLRLWLIERLVGEQMLIMNAHVTTSAGVEIPMTDFGPGAVIGNIFDNDESRTSTLIRPRYRGKR